MLKKIKNAFSLKNLEHNCFGCSSHNPIGLKLEFFKTENDFYSIWKPSKNYDGWNGIVHGGIQATLLDECSEWYIFTTYGRSAVTIELKTKYLKPLSSTKGDIKIFAKEVSKKRNIIEIETEIFDSDNILTSQGFGKFLMFSQETSKEKYGFPDISEFF
ncbi:MAG: PaaI family thioesterase [Bacteroidales bacterium]|nr:PaaI family thioesterase [Bacteroidales bacterium]MCK9499653.1 PaaI family thioesterase [Bacteroidales bacterium]NLB87205.1 PaaI family thioesterase [Bacteroidales bacterium]